MVGTLELIAAVIAVLGLGISALGVGSLGQWWRLYRRTPADAHQVSVGPTELEGRAEPLETYGTVRSGLTGEACLLYEYEVEEYESGQHGGSWTEIAAGSDAVPFAVADDTGRVLVDPDGANTILDQEYEERLEPGDDPSDTVASFLRRSDVDREHNTIDIAITELTYGDDQRFRERRIHAGETVYVAGVADRDVTDLDVGFGGPDAIIRADRNRGRFRRYLGYPFVISDYSETIAERALLKRSAWLLVIGVPVTLGGGYLFLTALA